MYKSGYGNINEEAIEEREFETRQEAEEWLQEVTSGLPGGNFVTVIGENNLPVLNEDGSEQTEWVCSWHSWLTNIDI